MNRKSRMRPLMVAFSALAALNLAPLSAQADVDYNGDGQSDLLWQNQTTGDVTVWFMNGAKQLNWAYIARGIPTDWKIVGTPDLNGDFSPDVLWQNQKTGD